MLRVLLVWMMAATAAEAGGPLSAAGRIEKIADATKTCSAALVAPDVVVTAAHCVSGSGGPGFLFRPGGPIGGPTYPVDRVAVHPLYDRENDPLHWRYRFDMAVARLAGPVPSEIAEPFAISREAEVGEELFLVSWRAGDGARPRQRRCPVIPGIRGLVTLACEVGGGESGAPLLRRTETGVALVAVLSSRTRQLDQPVAQASDVRLRLPPLLQLID